MISSGRPNPLLQGRHLVFVLAGEALGGAERAALELASYLRDSEGATVEVCALDDVPGAGRRLAASYGIPWSCIAIPWDGQRVENARSLARFALQLRGRRPDVVLASTNLPNVVSGLTWKTVGAKLFVWTQCDVNGTTRINQRLFRHALRRSPLVVTKGLHARDWLARTFGVEGDQVHVIYENVELATPMDDRPTWRRRLEIGEDDVVASMLAHFHPGKDHMTLLRAWRLVVDRLERTGPPVKLLLAGRDAGSQDAVKALAYDLDLRKDLRFVGEVEDVSGLLAASDLAVFCSHRELIGRGATEPMGAGLPVVGTDIPGIREAVGEPGEPFLARPGDPAALADSIVRVVLDPVLRERVGSASARVIHDRQADGRALRTYGTLLAGALAARAS